MYAEKYQVKQNCLIRGWISFVIQRTKTNFFTFLTVKIAEFTFPSSKLVYVTSGQSVLHRGSANLMPDCNHEEADTRIVMHYNKV